MASHEMATDVIAETGFPRRIDHDGGLVGGAADCLSAIGFTHTQPSSRSTRNPVSLLAVPLLGRESEGPHFDSGST